MFEELENIIKSAVVLCKGDIILPNTCLIASKNLHLKTSSYSVLDSALATHSWKKLDQAPIILMTR